MLLLLKLLTAISVIEGNLVAKRSALASPQNMADCINQMHVQNANLKQILECMARSSNLTAFMEDTQWKLELLERQLDRLQIIQSPVVYVRSPYANIDDVLKIEGSVAGYNFQSKLHVVQAIRRKLEQDHLLNGRESTLFEWPYTRQKAAAARTSSSTVRFNKESFRSMEPEIKELSCLIARAIERHAATSKGDGY